MEKTVYFRAFEEEDAEHIYKWMNDDELKRLSVGVNRRMCRAESLDWVKARMRDNRNQVWWAICAIDTDLMVGYAYLTDIHYINRSANYGGIVIGNKEYQDGMAWIETYLFVHEYAFERLGMNRLYGDAIVSHNTSVTMRKLMFWTTEGLKRQAVYKNGEFHDVSTASLLKDEYFYHKANGDYELSSIIKHLRQIRKSNNE